MPVALYQELIDLIIDEIAILCKATLCACSLTSWSFHISARKHLFQQIYITHRWRPSAPDSFLEKDQMQLDNLIAILESNPSRFRPSLSSDVRSLSMERIVSPSGISSFHNDAQRTKIQNRWEHFVSRLPILLQYLSGVQKLSLTIDAKCSWSSLSDAALLQFFVFPSLTSLRFGNIEQVPIISIISYCQNLRHLSVESCTLMKNEDITTSAPVVPLESLFIRNSSGIPFGLSYFYNQPDLPQKDPPMSWLSLKSLTVVRISADLFTSNSPGYRGPVYLNLLHNLRRLELRFDATFVSLHLSCLTTLGRVLHHLPQNTVEEFAILARWSVFDLEDGEDFSFENSDSTPLLFDIDAAFTGPNFPSLTKISLNFFQELWPLRKFSKPISEANNRFEMEIRNGLPSTNSSKIQLNVVVDTRFVRYALHRDEVLDSHP